MLGALEARNDRLGVGLGEDVLLANVENALDELADLRERWDNRLTVQNLALAKRYVEAKLKVLIEWEFLVEGRQKKVRAILQGEQSVSGLEKHRRKADGLRWSVGPGGNVHDMRNANGTVSGPYRYDSLVLVEDVELVESPEGFVPTLVWFQILDDRPSFGTGPLYIFAKAGFKFLPGFPDHKMNVVVASPVGVAMANDGNHKKVERGTRIVNSVADNHAKRVWDGPPDLKLPDALAGLQVVLCNDGVRIVGDERSCFIGELSDVAFGPFDL